MSHEAIARSKPLAQLREWHPDRARAIDAWVAANGKPEPSLRFLPLQARHGDMSVIIDAATGDVQGVLAIDPWE